MVSYLMSVNISGRLYKQLMLRSFNYQMETFRCVNCQII